MSSSKIKISAIFFSQNDQSSPVHCTDCQLNTPTFYTKYQLFVYTIAHGSFVEVFVQLAANGLQSESKEVKQQVLQPWSNIENVNFQWIIQKQSQFTAHYPRQSGWAGNRKELFSHSLTICKHYPISIINSLQCFDTVGWAAGRASGL